MTVSQAREPALEEVRARVREDAARQRREREMGEAVAKITARYDIVMDLEAGLEE